MNKDNFSLTPDFTRVHNPYCNCFECSSNSVDGVIAKNINHADVYLPDPGDVVNVLKNINATDKDGKPCILKAGTFLTPNVVKIITPSIGKNYIKLNDGTDNSPITMKYDRYAFEPANIINRNIFTPYSTGAKVVDRVATGVESAALGASDIISFTGKYFKWILLGVVAVIFVGIYLRFKGKL